MSDDWTTFNVKYFAIPITALVFGIVIGFGLDSSTNKQQNIRIEASSGLSKEEIEKMKQEAEANAESDKKAKEDVETINLGDIKTFTLFWMFDCTCNVYPIKMLGCVQN